MLISLFLLTVGMSLALLLLGYFVIREGKGGLGFKIAGYVILMAIGFNVLVSGVVVESGISEINATTDVITVTPTYESLDNGDLIIGIPIILMALIGIIVSAANDKKENDTYYAGGKPPA